MSDSSGSGSGRGPAPLAAQRRAAILARVRSDGAARVRELVEEFGVSDMTVRRDIEALAVRGLVTRVHGGATAVVPHAAEETAFLAKPARQETEKEAIAARAAQLVRPNTAIALAAGTTTATLARRLVEVPDLTVVTNSIPVADALERAPRADRTVILTGGIRTPSDALVGPLAAAAIRSLNVDQVFLGVHGMASPAGFTTPNFMEAETDRALIDAAREVVVLADHTKWDVVGLSTICPLREADVLVSDEGLGPLARSLLAAEVGELVLAAAEPAAA